MTTDVASAARPLRAIAFVGNHLPRQCGIATFTTDLTDAIAREFPAIECHVLAMNDPGKRYAYPPRYGYRDPRQTRPDPRENRWYPYR